LNGPIDSLEFRMTSNTKHLAPLQYSTSQCNCLGTRSNASSYITEFILTSIARRYSNRITGWSRSLVIRSQHSDGVRCVLCELCQVCKTYWNIWDHLLLFWRRVWMVTNGITRDTPILRVPWHLIPLDTDTGNSSVHCSDRLRGGTGSCRK